MTDTQSLARRIAEKLWTNGEIYSTLKAEQIIAAELEERDKKVRELIEEAESALGCPLTKLRDALK